MSIPVSVVVVSRDRPEALYLCILGLSQVQYTPFEIVVVADAVGLAALARFEGQIKAVLFEEPNISAARNVGITHAAGEIVAFMDDDAVPEPTWLSHLVGPFDRQEVAAVGGFVRGRNGISFQWKARVLDGMGIATDIKVDEVHPTILTSPKGQAVKTEGTNMAVRREVLAELGGFDPAYHFYLDETDLNMRLARAGYSTGIAPLAQVHHGFAQSNRRRVDRVPSDLFDIGASWSVFQRKFIPEESWVKHWHGIVKSERARLLNHMVVGGLEPKMVRKLMKRLFEGYAAGKMRAIGQSQTLPHAPDHFKPFPSVSRTNTFLSARPLSAKRMQAVAKNQVNEGQITTLFILSPTSFFHHVRFHIDGYWLQTGGLFGKSNRSQKVFRLWSRKRRVVFEKLRVSLLRSKVTLD